MSDCEGDSQSPFVLELVISATSEASHLLPSSANYRLFAFGANEDEAPGAMAVHQFPDQQQFVKKGILLLSGDAHIHSYYACGGLVEGLEVGECPFSPY